MNKGFLETFDSTEVTEQRGLNENACNPSWCFICKKLFKCKVLLSFNKY